MVGGIMTGDVLCEPHLGRKRRYDDDDEEIDTIPEQQSKRQYFGNLAFRSPRLSQRPSIAVTPAFAQFGAPGTLTPESLSEDEFNRADEHWARTQLPGLSLHPSIESNSSSASNASLLVQVDTNDSNASMMDTDMMPPSPSGLRRIGRARSNDLMSPVHSPVTSRKPSLLGPPRACSLKERLPTPVTSTFGLKSPFSSTFSSIGARQLRPQTLQTTLSPMTDAESWTPMTQRPPSPEPDDEPMMGDQDTEMIEDANSSFGALKVDNDDWNVIDSSPTRRQNYGLGLSEGPSQHLQSKQAQGSSAHGRNDSRTARLRMGFRADCEKCVQRVPGHYAHIDWT